MKKLSIILFVAISFASCSVGDEIINCNYISKKVDDFKYKNGFFFTDKDTLLSPPKKLLFNSFDKWRDSIKVYVNFNNLNFTRFLDEYNADAMAVRDCNMILIDYKKVVKSQKTDAEISEKHGISPLRFQDPVNTFLIHEITHFVWNSCQFKRNDLSIKLSEFYANFMQLSYLYRDVEEIESDLIFANAIGDAFLSNEKVFATNESTFNELKSISKKFEKIAYGKLIFSEEERELMLNVLFSENEIGGL